MIKMKWAIKNNEKILATPKQKAGCPICNSEVISKCGKIKIWHWSHLSNKDCDDWYEPESEWHRSWKNEFPKEQQEFTMGKHRADIRTSQRYIIELQNSSISSNEIIEREEYYKRMVWLLNGNKLAKGLNLRIRSKPSQQKAKGNQTILQIKSFQVFTFRWKHPPKSWWKANKEIYIHLEFNYILNKLNLRLKNINKEIEKCINGFKYDYFNGRKCDIERIINYYTNLNNKIFVIQKLYNNIPCGGWGYLISKEEFINKFK